MEIEKYAEEVGKDNEGDVDDFKEKKQEEFEAKRASFDYLKNFEAINVDLYFDYNPDEKKQFEKRYAYDQGEIDDKLAFFKLLTGNVIENVQGLLDTETYKFLERIGKDLFG